MKRRSILALCLTALTACVLVSPAAALEPEPISTTFRLQDSNGFLLYVSAYSESGDGRGEVAVIAERKGSVALYGVSGTVTADTIRADFGDLGRIDVVLDRSGRLKKFRRECRRPELYEPATYRGTIRFKGERGYVRASQAEAPLVPLPAGSACGSGSGESITSGLPGARLRGLSLAHGRRLTFQLNKNHQGGRTRFSAEIRERRAGLQIFRAVEGFVSSSAFDYAPDLRQAKVSAPAPFSGSASLRRGRNSVSPLWSGDLAVDFPGRTARLAGPGMNVSLVPACFTLSDEPSIASC